jgi:hypothetical protein
MDEWDAVPYTVWQYGSGNPKNAQKKSKKTCLERYGVENVSQNPEIARKMARGFSTSTVRPHWKTGEELVCQASYELKVVEHLNAEKMDFLWQPEIFSMPNGKTYRPDLFLIKENKWVEIKGYMRPHSQLKWDWFQSLYPNSELWDKKKLKEVGIL